jgi:hypothetical protein
MVVEVGDPQNLRMPAAETITYQVPEQFVAEPASADDGNFGIFNFTDH